MDPFRLKQRKERWFSFLRWLPVIGAGVLLLLVAVVSVHVLSKLRTATAWRRHTVQVILTADAFQDNLFNIQRNMRGYVTDGDTNALASYQKSIAIESEQFRQLVQLTSDNLDQQLKLKRLDAAIHALFLYDKHLVGVFDSSGTVEALKTDPAGATGREVFGKASDILNDFSATEEKLLDVRDAVEQSSYHVAEKLLLAACVLAAILIVFANLVASH